MVQKTIGETDLDFRSYAATFSQARQDGDFLGGGLLGVSVP